MLLPDAPLQPLNSDQPVPDSGSSFRQVYNVPFVPWTPLFGSAINWLLLAQLKSNSVGFLAVYFAVAAMAYLWVRQEQCWWRGNVWSSFEHVLESFDRAVDPFANQEEDEEKEEKEELSETDPRKQDQEIRRGAGGASGARGDSSAGGGGKYAPIEIESRRL